MDAHDGARPTISGFMVVRDVESQGYPFLEAASCALAACEEIIISDGGSRDRTWEGLLALREAHGERVRLYRDPWPGPENWGAILARVTNVARRRCAGEWCLSVQANELIPERSARALRELVDRRPPGELFALPYLLLLGPHLATGISIRGRLFRNIPDLIAVGDACEVAGVLPARPVARITYGLPEPIYRYRALFPEHYLAKLRTIRPRTRSWAIELAHAEAALEVAAVASDPLATFWRLVRGYLEEECWIEPGAGTGAGRGPVATTEDAPAAARHLRWRWSYDLDDSLTWLAGATAAA